MKERGDNFRHLNSPMLQLCNMNEGLPWENAESKNWIKETRVNSVGFRNLSISLVFRSSLALLILPRNSDVPAWKLGASTDKHPILWLMTLTLGLSKKLLVAVSVGRTRPYQRLYRDCGKSTCFTELKDFRNRHHCNRLRDSVGFSSHLFRTGRKILWGLIPPPFV